MVTIRPALAADCAAIADIYGYYVDNTVATFDYEAPSVAAWEAKLSAIEAAGRPFLVAEEIDGAQSSGVLGFAYLGPFRDKRAYERTVEDTIYLRRDAGGRGIGTTLLAALVDAADPQNVRQIIAVIAATGGEASIALHRKNGFAEVGRTPAVGYKFDQWIDCVYLQRSVG
ncbi:N-acetyltransferase family protein [Gordonia sp. LSe1-13]|uniref:N-acetyltransferase family protein n=1 Tax=Gordonia sesuvii TaxID=3116777 RepID=A0ABU7M7C3_9ACTN|nr:N-acetyltransferase family protein [Gordonia sp. LSe1-13]